MSERAPYSRVYWTIVDDPKFADIYDDDHHLAAWLRLLLAAEQSHPASAFVPSGLRKASVAALVEARLITVTGSRFRVCGLDAERAKRSESARNAAAYRWQSDRNNGTNAGGMPRRDETRRGLDETTREASDYDGRDDLEAFLLVTRRAPTPKQRKVLDDVLSLHDESGPKWAADLILKNPADPIGAILEADQAYRAERVAEIIEKPTPRPKRKPSLPESTRELLEHWKATGQAEEQA